MDRTDLSDLLVFLTVAEEHSFTRAAARLGTSQSSLSNVVRRLEERLDLRLLTRTTRNVAPTEAGQLLLERLRPAFAEIENGLIQLDELRQKPAGTLRITADRHAARTILMPVAMQLMGDYPDLRIEISVEQRLVDIVQEQFDAGVRLGEDVEQDMIAVPVGPEVRMAVVGAPAYFRTHPRPRTPHDLTDHLCINLRLETLKNLYAWEFEKKRRALNVRVAGQFICNDPDLILEAALQGRGLAFLLEGHSRALIEEKRLVRVLEDWCPPFPGYHLYYPSRRQLSIGFRLLVDALRANVGNLG